MVDRDWGTPPLEPLSIHTADFDAIPLMDRTDHGGHRIPSCIRDPAAGREPLLCRISPSRCRSVRPRLTAVARPAECRAARRAHAGAQRSHRGDAAAGAQCQRAAEDRHRAGLCQRRAVGGSQLLSALELHGLAYGRYQVFHRRHGDGRSLFCVASLIEPGTFDVARMADEEFAGVTLFAVLPGPLEPLLTVDELLGAARDLAQALTGTVQDAKGMPLSPQRAAAMRDDVARFQASLPPG